MAAAVIAKLSVQVPDDERKRTGLNLLVIHPKRQWKSAWEIFIVICVGYSSVTAPLKVTYRIDFMEGLDVFLDVVFVLDIIIQCFSGYYDLGGSRFPVLRLDKVVERYAETWMAIDIIAGIPFDRMISGVGWMQLFKTVRLIKMRRILRKWNSLSIGPLIKVITIVCFWLLCAHWLSCGFFATAWATCETFSARYPEYIDEERCVMGNRACNGNWITTYWPTMADSCIAALDPAAASNASGIPIISIHIRAFAWSLATMSSMGYGESPKAVSDLDYVYAFLTQVCGACLAAAIFSNIGQMINQGDQAGQRYQQQLDKITEFCELYKLDWATRKQLIEYHELLFSAYRGFDLQQVAKLFPQQLQESVFWSMHKEIITKVPEFTGAEVEMLKQLALGLTPQVLLRGDYAFRVNEIGDAMFFINFGTIDITNKDSSIIYLSKKPGTYFGEIAVFSEERRTASAMAHSDSMLHCLSKAAVDAAGRRYPESYKIIHDNALAERKRITDLNRLSDLAYPAVTYPAATYPAATDDGESKSVPAQQLPEGLSV